MRFDRPLDEYIETRPSCIQAKANLKEVDKIFDETEVDYLLVGDEEHLEGIITRADFRFFKRGFTGSDTNRQMVNLKLMEYKAEDIMIRTFRKLNSHELVSRAIKILSEGEWPVIPVFKDDKVMGAVSSMDIIRKLNQT